MLRPAQSRRTNVRRIAALTIALTAALLLIIFAGAERSEAAPPELRYPDLKTLKPSQLRFATVKRGGETLNVLRFTNTVWNAGPGPLELRGNTVRTPSGSKTEVRQRIKRPGNGFKVTESLGTFVYHPLHDHFHFGDFARYELWKKGQYDRWVNNGERAGRAERQGAKTTFCVMDTEYFRQVPGGPQYPIYDACTRTKQGLSAGFADTYVASLPGQFIRLGTSPPEDPLPKGRYVLRSVADPNNRIYESPTKRSWKDSQKANAAVTFFRVKNGELILE